MEMQYREAKKLNENNQPKRRRGKPATDITGKKFGRLTAMYPTAGRDSKGSVVWHCMCDCGNEVDVSYNDLLYTNRKSCGCQKRENDRILKERIIHVSGTSVDALKSKKVPVNNTTGIRGVYLIRGKYVAKIVFQKKAYYLGTFDSLEEAGRARHQAETDINETAVQFYHKWSRVAGLSPTWAQQNPISMQVQRGEDKHLSLLLEPELPETSIYDGPLPDRNHLIRH